EHARDGVEGLVPLRAFGRTVDHEATELRLRRRLTGPELHATVADQVEGGHALGHAGWVVEPHRKLHDPVAEADALGALAACGQEDLWRRGVAVLLEEVVLHLPHVVDPEPVGQLHLLERALEELVLAVAVPGTRQLVLVEDAELHFKTSRASSNRRNRGGLPCFSRRLNAMRRLLITRSHAARPGHGRGSSSGGRRGSLSKHAWKATAMENAPGRKVVPANRSSRRSRS